MLSKSNIEYNTKTEGNINLCSYILKLTKSFLLRWDKIREDNNYTIIQFHHHHLTKKFNLANKFENKKICQIASQFYIIIFKLFTISDLYFCLFINEVFKNNKIKERNKDVVYLYYNIDEYKKVM